MFHARIPPRYYLQAKGTHVMETRRTVIEVNNEEKVTKVVTQTETIVGASRPENIYSLISSP